jgi:hypothetical protein
MTEFSVTIHIAASPDQIWSVMRDVERWHEWTPTVTSIRKKDPGPIAVGSRLFIRQPKLPPATWRVVELKEGEGFTSVTGSPLGARITARHAITRNEGGCEVLLSVRFSGLLAFPVARLTRSLNERYLQLEANGLKRRSEELRSR